ncbi:MAG: nitronate monooxygenase [Bowdeniella nasicola]|nr:nitronate monooxygenase [Bowdeniella nasicola]
MTIAPHYPLAVAPMAGGPTTPELVAAVAEAGGIGMLAGADRDGSVIAQEVREVRRATSGLIGVNLFVPEPLCDPSGALASVRAYRATLAGTYDSWDVDWPAVEDCAHEWSNADQLRAIVAAGPDLITYTFGFPDRAARAVLRETRIPWWGDLCGPGHDRARARARHLPNRRARNGGWGTPLDRDHGRHPER